MDSMVLKFWTGFFYRLKENKRFFNSIFFIFYFFFFYLLFQYMFGALRDCVPQLRQACHEEVDDKMVTDFKVEIMDILKEVL